MFAGPAAASGFERRIAMPTLADLAAAEHRQTARIGHEKPVGRRHRADILPTTDRNVGRSRAGMPTSVATGDYHAYTRRAVSP